MLLLIIGLLSIQTVTCQGCDPGQYWGGIMCLQCPENCKTCRLSTTVSCDTCNNGFYGVTCLSQCPEGCLNQRCKKETGECDCKNGYFKYYSNCYTCPKTCRTCTASDSCNTCIPGYYGRHCQKYCPLHCKDKECESNGFCTCNQGYFSKKDINDGQYHCATCPGFCRNNTCTSEGRCQYGCQDGYYLINNHCVACRYNCSECTAGANCQRCFDGFWGYVCRRKCFESCRRCDKRTGLCIDCMGDTFGRTCGQRCSSDCLPSADKSSSCWRSNGTCIHGCREGFTGANCTDELPQTSSSSTSVIVGSVFGCILVVGVMIGIIILMFRRRSKKKYYNTQRKYGARIRGLFTTKRTEVVNPVYGDIEILSNAPSDQSSAPSGDVTSGSTVPVYSVVKKPPRQRLKKGKRTKGQRSEEHNGYEMCALGEAGNIEVSQGTEEEMQSHSNYENVQLGIGNDAGTYYNVVISQNVQTHDVENEHDITDVDGVTPVQESIAGDNSAQSTEYSTIDHATQA